MYFITQKKFFYFCWFEYSKNVTNVTFTGRLGSSSFKYSFKYYLPFFIKAHSFSTNYFLTFSKKFVSSFNATFVNLIHGVFSGYFRYLELKGVGFKVLYSASQHVLFFFTGYNHITSFKLPTSVQIKIRKQYILIFSYNNAVLSHVAYQIKSVRFPDSYRGKGIVFREEVLKNKPGKQR